MCADVQMSRMRAAIFHLRDEDEDCASATEDDVSDCPKQPREADGGSSFDNVMPQGQSRNPEKTIAWGHRRLTFEEMLEKVAEVRPDQPLSALDLEAYKAKLVQQASDFRAQLSRIESTLDRLNQQGGIQRDSS